MKETLALSWVKTIPVGIILDFIVDTEMVYPHWVTKNKNKIKQKGEKKKIVVFIISTKALEK